MLLHDFDLTGVQPSPDDLTTLIADYRFIWQHDDRTEMYMVEDEERWKSLIRARQDWKSWLPPVSISKVRQGILSNATCVGFVTRNSFAVSNIGDVTHQDRIKKEFGNKKVCSDNMEQRFITQPSIAGLTCFAVSSRLLVTAGHGLKPEIGTEYKVIFDYKLRSNQTLGEPVLVTAKVKWIQQQYFADWAVLELAEELPENRVLRNVSSSKKNLIGSRVYSISHPRGLPQKFIPDAVVQAKVSDSPSPTTWSANLDMFRGSSGGPVFDSSTHSLLGLWIRGKANDYYLSDDDCVRTTVGKSIDMSNEIFLDINYVMNQIKKL